MMKSLTLKSLTIISLLSSSLLSKTIDEKVLRYEKHRISANPNIQLTNIKLNFKKDLPDNNWVGYVYNISLKMQGKTINIKDIVFSDGLMITPELKKLKNGQSYKKYMYPTLSSKYFKDEYRIAGNKDAQHKIVVFSDPLCPICTEVIPEIILDVKKHPKILSLYYIHMPLDMHPTAKLIAKASTIAKHSGIKDIDYKVYTAQFEDNFNAYQEKDREKVLKIFNKKFNTNITMEQIDGKELNEELKYHLKLSDEALIQGTPTVFFDSQIDPMRNKYKKYIK